MELTHASPRLWRVTVVVAAGLLLVALAAGARIIDSDEQVAAAAAPADIQGEKFLGRGYLKQDASPGGTSNTLLNLGALDHKSVCKAVGGGAVRLQVFIRSFKAGGMAMTPNGHILLGDAFKEIWIVEGTGPIGFAQGYDVLYKDGTYRHFQVDFAVNHGRDCVSRLVASTTE